MHAGCLTVPREREFWGILGQFGAGEPAIQRGCPSRPHLAAAGGTAHGAALPRAGGEGRKVYYKPQTRPPLAKYTLFTYHRKFQSQGYSSITIWAPGSSSSSILFQYLYFIMERSPSINNFHQNLSKPMKFVLKSTGYYYARYNSLLSDKLGRDYGFETKSHREKI